MHGFSILKKLYKSDVMDYSSIDPTGLYRTLKKMEESGLLVSRIESDGGLQAKRSASSSGARRCSTTATG